MKKIFILFLGLSFALLSACKKEKISQVSSNITTPVISNPTDGTSIVVTTADTAQVLKIDWGKPDYGVSAVVDYFIQVDSAGRNFAHHMTLANLTSVNTLSLTYGSFNSKLLSGLNLPPNALSNLELRVGTAIYGKDTVFSKPITLALTTLAINQLWLPGSYEGYNPAGAPTIPALTPNTYEGYAYFNASGNFKFTSAPDYNHINYGDGGNGKLTTDGNAGGIGYPSAGVYKLNADVSGLTYSATFISTFGIIGTATPHAWDASTAMTYDVATGLWKVTVNLVPGALKFRANDAWDINYGPADANALTGTLIFNDPGAVTIVDAGSYTVTLDMTQTTTKAYSYKIAKIN